MSNDGFQMTKAIALVATIRHSDFVIRHSPCRTLAPAGECQGTPRPRVLPMPSAAQIAQPRPLAFAVCWSAVAAGGVGLMGLLVQVWRVHPDTADRLLIILAAVWLVCRRRDALAGPRSPTWTGLLLIAPAALLTPPSWYLTFQIGPRTVLLWWLTGLWLAAVAGLILVQFGRQALRALAFPLAFLLFALPLPTSITRPLQVRLQDATTSMADAALSAIGIPVERAGYVLQLPSGDLGVVEACSGVRSVTAIIAVAALVAYVRGFGMIRGLLLVILALPIVAFANAVRVILNGALQEWVGTWVNEGVTHEALGVIALLVALWAVLLVSQWLRQRDTRHETRDTRQDSSVSCLVSRISCLSSAIAASLFTVALAGVCGAAWLVSLAEPPATTDAPLDEIATRIGPWSGEDQPINADILSALASDNAIHRVYRNPAGQEIHVWVIYYSAATAVRDYVHHPDVCWPSHGWATIGTDRRPVALPPPARLDLMVRRFERGGQRRMVGYWVQDGAAVWTEDDFRRTLAALPTWGEIRERLSGGGPLKRTPRLSVLFGAELWENTGYAEQSVNEFVRDFAAELYRVCPWALPVPALSEE
jgi:EpsI family protein